MTEPTIGFPNNEQKLRLQLIARVNNLLSTFKSQQETSSTPLTANSLNKIITDLEDFIRNILPDITPEELKTLASKGG